MARWRRTFLTEAMEQLAQLGVRTCPVCGSERLSAHLHPVLLSWGDLPPDPAGTEQRDPDGNIDFMVRVECGICGHTMLFNSERFRGPDASVLIKGLTEEEEAALERDNPL